MQLENCLALTLTRSPGREDRLPPRRKSLPNVEASAAMESGLPLLGGEGRGEGERFFLLIRSGLGLPTKALLTQGFE